MASVSPVSAIFILSFCSPGRSDTSMACYAPGPCWRPGWILESLCRVSIELWQSLFVWKFHQKQSGVSNCERVSLDTMQPALWPYVTPRLKPADELVLAERFAPT